MEYLRCFLNLNISETETAREAFSTAYYSIFHTLLVLTKHAMCLGYKQISEKTPLEIKRTIKSNRRYPI